ncbi:Xenotropic and polytropic retrovirus receptor 1 [Seminavis robusta]|uniref:Xenotropic and polytropic retrovirus receptor 1 n=1 Tax=Seminavis robusta TaxID=568900 RepID=A0A9N8H4X2_9STRA|nr:Xenotropic and polytropic retrovirus receptor 1 [Seminavis robusta]|eukprot:Sro73_g040200.1 Xenotropic and polytropic retrovirus receptor 1 (708) ;mRNA; r:7992-10115
MSTQPQPQQQPQQPQIQRQYRIGSKVICVILLFGSLLVLREESSSNDDSNTLQKYSAVFMALRKHPPSLRIFRSLLEWNLLLWGTVVSLKLWYQYVGESTVAELLFSGTTSDASHMDYGDLPGHAHDAKARSSTYSGVRFADVESENSFQSEIMFVDYDASFSEVLTGTIENDEDLNYIVGIPTQQSQKSSSQTPKELGDPIVSNTQKRRQSTPDDDDDSDPFFSATPQSKSPRAPNVHAVTSAALDMLLPILLALFFFTLFSTKKVTYQFPQLAWVAPLIPLLLVVYLVVTQIVLQPWAPTQHFLTVLSWTISAPLYPVTFRDGFIGDIFTSTVRPLQDMAFTICYILSGLQGYWSDGYEGFWDSVQHNPHHLNDDDDTVLLLQDNSNNTPTSTAATTDNNNLASQLLTVLPPLETSWWLHTVLLPMCMVSPLWWRFLQNLRQTHDNKRRWPYLGNAFKYLLAAEVAMFGVFDPSKQQTWHWLGWFVIATLYQVWWDVFMDWELLLLPQEGGMLPLKLRPQRLYPSKAFYWTILVVNVLLRFCWTLSFLPPRYLNQAGVLSDTFQHSDWSRALAPAIASAEIIRRTMWGWLRLENEAIKVQQQQSPAQIMEFQFLRGINPEEAFGDALVDEGIVMQSMNVMDNTASGTTSLQRWTINKRQGVIPALWEKWKTMEDSNEIQILAELALWATVFAALGMIAAAHRMTL